MIKTPIRAVSWHGPFIDDSDGARIASADSIATRDRIIACVNACAGVADSLLTPGAFKSIWETYQAQLERLVGCDDKVGGLSEAVALERKRTEELARGNAALLERALREGLERMAETVFIIWYPQLQLLESAQLANRLKAAADEEAKYRAEVSKWLAKQKKAFFTKFGSLTIDEITGEVSVLFVSSSVVALPTSVSVADASASCVVPTAPGRISSPIGAYCVGYSPICSSTASKRFSSSGWSGLRNRSR